MSEISREVRPIQVDYQCPKCGIGFLRPTGVCYTSNPPQYPHVCNNPDCEYSENIWSKTYPYIKYA